MIDHVTKTLMDVAMNGAAALFDSSRGKRQLMPVFIVETVDGRSGIVGAPFTSAEEKAATLEFMRAHLAEVGAVRYAFVAETWLVKSATGERTEAIAVWGSDRSDQAILVREIKRATDGTGTLGEPEWADALGGDFFNLLPGALQ